MPNPLTNLAVTTINGIGDRQGRTYSVERGILEPGNAAHVQKYGLSLLGDAWKTPSRGLRSEERRVGKECRSRWSPYH